MSISGNVFVVTDPASNNAKEYTIVGAKVQNGNFETGSLSGWVASSRTGISVEGTKVYEGSYAAWIGHDGIISQTINGLTPNTTYTVTAMVWSDNVDDYAIIGAKNFGGTTQEVATQWGYLVWRERSVTFTTGSSNTSAEIYAKHGGTGWKWVHIDNVTIAKQ